MGAGTHNVAWVFDEALIAKRSEVIGYGIDATAALPDEESYTYHPFAEQGLEYQRNEEAKASLHDYNTGPQYRSELSRRLG